MREDRPVTTGGTKPQTSFSLAGFGRNRFRFALLTLALLGFVAILYLCARSGLFAPPTLRPGDLLLLEPESVARVEAAARVGDIVAQSILGSAYLEGRGDVSRNVTKAVYWLQKVADRDRSEFDRIPSRMQSLLDKRAREFDLRERRTIDVEYLDLVARKLAFESAFFGLIEVYLGSHGDSHANTALALKYLRRGASYGFPFAQRMLGIVTQYGLLGVARDEIQATILLNEAAAQGDLVAQRLLVSIRIYHDAMLRARTGTTVSGYSFS
jgi:TPR repeat protein